uniref:Uncharacterized protein n=11 Tax=Aegilops tauschii subsp. strangulata TaxID=200361 RepID=A0A453KQJ2_AEGTS
MSLLCTPTPSLAQPAMGSCTYCRGRSGEGDRVTTARAQETSGSCSPRMPTSGSGKKLLNPGDREIVEPRADPPRTPPPRGASTLSELRAALACYHDLNKSGGSREEEVLIGGGRRSCHRGGGFLESGGRVEEESFFEGRW